MHDAYGSLDLYYTAQIDAGQLFYEDDDDSFSVPTDDDEDRPVTSPNNGACSTSTICNPTETKRTCSSLTHAIPFHSVPFDRQRCVRVWHQCYSTDLDVRHYAHVDLLDQVGTHAHGGTHPHT